MRKRRVIIRITPLGYTVLGGLVGILVLGITLIALSIKSREPARDLSSATPQPTAPVEDSAATPAFKSVSAGSYIAAPEAVSVTMMPQILTPTPEPIATTRPSPTPSPETIDGVRAPTAEQIKFAVDGKLTANGVALRKGPATSFAILDKYDDGTVLKVFSIEGDYYFCQIVGEGERYGYFAAKFVTKFGALSSESGGSASAYEAPLARGSYQGIVIADKGVSLRTMPTTNGNTPIGECVKDTALIVYFQTGDFYYIEVAATGLKAYAYAAFISVNGSVPQGTPVP